MKILNVKKSAFIFSLLSLIILAACAPVEQVSSVEIIPEPSIENEQPTGTALPAATLEEVASPEPSAQVPLVATYTLEEVALHNTAADCWLVVNGAVINVTSFIPDHPGGDRILAGCGKDASSLFEGVDDHIGRAVGLLITYQIGFLAE